MKSSNRTGLQSERWAEHVGNIISNSKQKYPKIISGYITYIGHNVCLNKAVYPSKCCETFCSQFLSHISQRILVFHRDISHKICWISLVEISPPNMFQLFLFAFWKVVFKKLWGNMASTHSSGGICLANLSLKTLGVIICFQQPLGRRLAQRQEHILGDITQNTAFVLKIPSGRHAWKHFQEALGDKCPQNFPDEYFGKYLPQMVSKQLPNRSLKFFLASTFQDHRKTL